MLSAHICNEKRGLTPGHVTGKKMQIIFLLQIHEPWEKNPWLRSKNMSASRRSISDSQTFSAHFSHPFHFHDRGRPFTHPERYMVGFSGCQSLCHHSNDDGTHCSCRWGRSRAGQVPLCPCIWMHHCHRAQRYVLISVNSDLFYPRTASMIWLLKQLGFYFIPIKQTA
jgi:hypothetical protein